MTNDIKPLQLGEVPVVYSALLSPQGKIRFDFFLFLQSDTLLMDVPNWQLEDILKILKLYKLRAKVSINEAPEYAVIAELYDEGELPDDPRLSALGKRGIVQREALIGKQLLPELSYHAHRIKLGIPDSIDFIPDRAFVAEYGLEKLHGVSFTKGCYVGQEIVARTHHRGAVHKKLHQVSAAEGEFLPEIGTPILLGDKEVGTLRSSVENQGLAILRMAKIENRKAPLMAGEVEINSAKLPEWFA